MASVNKVIIVGNLGADPEVRFTPGGQAVATLNIATNERWKDKSGQNQERTEWHRVVFWGRQAELCRDYLAKGRTIYVEGRLQTRKWEDKQGQTRYTTEIIGQTMQFLGGGAGAGAGAGGGRDRGGASPDMDQGAGMTASDAGSPPPFDSDEDIPF